MALHGPPPHRKAIEVSIRNGTYQQLESLQKSRHKRFRLGLTLIEGVRLIEAANRFDVPIEALLYNKGKQPSPWARRLIQSSRAERLLELSPALFEELSRRSEIPELMAVIRTPEDQLSRISLSATPLVLILDRPANPGNIGSIIRSADALGADGVIVYGRAADLYSPEAVSASMGSLFTLPTIRVERGAVLFQWFAECKRLFPAIRVVGADERGELPLAECDLTQPTIFVIGNEAEGISAALQNTCDVRTRIPMTGFASSLNAACATTICLYEAMRQRS